MWRILSSLSEVAVLVTTGSLFSLGQRGNVETIDATAFGTSTQLGSNFGVKIIIYELSNPEDRKILVKAFHEGQNDRLVNALEKMKTYGKSLRNSSGETVSTYRMQVLDHG